MLWPKVFEEALQDAGEGAKIVIWRNAFAWELTWKVLWASTGCGLENGHVDQCGLAFALRNSSDIPCQNFQSSERLREAFLEDAEAIMYCEGPAQVQSLEPAAGRGPNPSEQARGVAGGAASRMMVSATEDAF